MPLSPKAQQDQACYPTLSCVSCLLVGHFEGAGVEDREHDCPQFLSQCHLACCVALRRLLASLNHCLFNLPNDRSCGQGFGPNRTGVLCPVTFPQVASPLLSWEPDILPGSSIQTMGMVASENLPLQHARPSCCYFYLLLVNLCQCLGIEPAPRRSFAT